MLRRPGVLLAALSVVLGVTTGCGAAGRANPEKVGPRGVDELVVPTPDPDPADFVTVVDNPWLPLAVGTTWTYEVTDSVLLELEVRVDAERRTIAGVSCVVVQHTGTDSGGAVVLQGDSYFAQDTRGNVWLFGEETRDIDPELRELSRSWTAGDGGAEAGLAMPATPRVGDGWVRALTPLAADRSSVLSLDEERTVRAGTFRALLLVEDTLDHRAGGQPVLERAYAEGVGLVEQTTDSSAGLRLALVSATTPPD